MKKAVKNVMRLLLIPIFFCTLLFGIGLSEKTAFAEEQTVYDVEKEYPGATGDYAQVSGSGGPNWYFQALDTVGFYAYGTIGSDSDTGALATDTTNTTLQLYPLVRDGNQGNGTPTELKDGSGNKNLDQIFDEAQRAWTQDELQRFMREKKGIKDFPYSEPEYLISCMDRQLDWGVVVCLVGNGQSINKGEAGLTEWIESVHRNYRDWDVYMSEYLLTSGDVTMEQLEIIRPQIKSRDSLHLKMSMRSFRSEKVSIFVNQLLALQKEEATSTLRELVNYPIVITRSLYTAKQWLRAHTRGSERMGLLASSKAERLKAISINVRYQPDFVHWFLEDDSDIRSSNALEDTLTEFKVQGLEIDWACVAWDADLRLSKDHTSWQHYQLRSGTKWQNINKPINREYQINAYRVLLTRARQGMVIVVPKGDYSLPPDETRKPEWYDEIYDYLKEVGIKEI